ncbi:MAG: SDR family NAD(P)-dependent oxidoreductase, partial [Puniceicoccales bacterium]|nr:SDR family NAD(P)-dependent oxidoreductase [Puniceicoccales bacterium]
MDVIFLTGAGSEPAQSIAGRLIASGFRVYGFDARFPAQGLSHADFFPVPVNLADASAVNAALAPILARETGVTGVVIAGNYPVPDTFEVTHEGDIPLALGAAVTAPMLLVRAVLPMLVRLHGHVVAITHAGTPAHGALSAACAGALQAFIRTLFEELRDTGVKAAHLRIEENATPDPAARYTQAPQSEVQPEIVADTIETLFRFRENNALTELVLRPQATREEPRIPVTHEPRLRAIQVVQLPPPKNLVPEELIPTPERKRPAYAPPPEENDGTDADEDDDDDNSVDPELLYLVRPKHQRPQPPQNTGAVDEDDDGTDDAPPQRQQQQRGQHDDRRRAPQGQQQQPQQRPDSSRIQLRGPTPRIPEAQARRQ